MYLLAYVSVLRGTLAQRTIRLLESDYFLKGMEASTMSRVKQTSTKKRVMKSAPVLGAAGLTFSMIGGASAAAVPTADVAQSPTVGLGHQVTLGEEEIADVSLATFSG